MSLHSDSAGVEQAEHDRVGYTDRLRARRSWWKRALNTQAPYRWHVRRIVEGEVLDVGCGVGRNLLHLDRNGVGVDSNPHSVAVSRDQGLTVYSTDEWSESPDAQPGRYDSMLIAHVLEHMPWETALSVTGDYLPYVKPGGRVVVIVPQSAGFRTDPTHVHLVTPSDLRTLADHHGLVVERIYSFPLIRLVGKIFRYNETVALLRTPSRLLGGGGGGGGGGGAGGRGGGGAGRGGAAGGRAGAGAGRRRRAAGAPGWGGGWGGGGGR